MSHDRKSLHPQANVHRSFITEEIADRVAWAHSSPLGKSPLEMAYSAMCASMSLAGTRRIISTTRTTVSPHEPLSETFLNPSPFRAFPHTNTNDSAGRLMLLAASASKIANRESSDEGGGERARPDGKTRARISRQKNAKKNSEYDKIRKGRERVMALVGEACFANSDAMQYVYPHLTPEVRGVINKLPDKPQPKRCRRK